MKNKKYDVFVECIDRIYFTVEAGSKAEARKKVESRNWDNKLIEFIKNHGIDNAKIKGVQENRDEFYCLNFEENEG